MDYDLESTYRTRFERALTPLAQNLEQFIMRLDLRGKYPRIDRITVRAKSIDRFLEKAMKIENGKLKYSDPINQIQDQVGARIVTFYTSDIDPVADIVKDYFNPIEELQLVPDSVSEFGYEGRHLLNFIPDDIFTPEIPGDLCPTFFELQIKTLFQYAWSEAGHDLAYKPHIELTHEQKRMVAFTAAQSWGADQIFNQLAHDLGIMRR